jgi:chorismate dehydratase
MKLLIAKIPYLSNVLFYYGLETNPETLANLDFITLIPSELSSAVAGEKVDAGPIPLVTMFAVGDRYEPLGDLCVATTGRTRSVLLFSRRPIETLDKATIGLSRETVTAARLLRVLFAQLYGVKIKRYVSANEPNDGILLVGDQALLNRNGIEGYPHITDLGEVWYDRTGLPFVYSVWMVRKALPSEQKEYLKTVLANSVTEGWKHLTAALADKTKNLGMSRAAVREYLDSFIFRMGPAEHDGIAKFTELEIMTRNLEAEETADPAGSGGLTPR